MSANTAPSEEDRRIAQHLDSAAREIEAALRVAQSAPKTAGYRLRRTTRDLADALARVNSVRTITPRHGHDADLVPEEERISQHRERVAQEREERWAARRAARGNEVTSG